MMGAMNQIFNAFRGSGNPMMLLQNLAQSDPKYGSVLNAINESNGDYKQAFYKMAEQQGVDPEAILSQIPSNFK